MRASRAVIVTGVCAAIIAAGVVAAPEKLPTLDLVVPASDASSGDTAATEVPTP